MLTHVLRERLNKKVLPCGGPSNRWATCGLAGGVAAEGTRQFVCGTHGAGEGSFVLFKR